MLWNLMHCRAKLQAYTNNHLNEGKDLLKDSADI